MFGRKNGRRVEPLKNKNKKNASDFCGGCCESLAKQCGGCVNHGWFLTLFCGYVLVSSLPRILIILDFIITLALYFQYNYKHGLSELRDQVWIDNSYTFKHSTFDLVIVSFIRCIILFICFAYRYQREGFRKNIYISFATVTASSIYLIVKLYFNTTDIVIFSLSFVWIECTFFFMVRRRRIRYAPISHSYYSLSQGNRKVMKPIAKQSKYYRIDDDSTKPSNPLKDSNSNVPIYDTYLDDIDIEYKEEKPQKKQRRKKRKKKHSPRMDIDYNYNNNLSIEHSISATMPDSEFSAHELPLRVENSEFHIIDGVAIHYCIERCHGDHGWVILLHGFGGGVFSYKRCLPLILNKMDNDINGVLAFDRVGFGLTERPIHRYPIAEDEEMRENETENDNIQIAIDKQIKMGKSEESDESNPYSIHFSLKIIKTFIEKFEMKKCIFIGHSTGALISNWFTYHYPQYVSALILVSPTRGMPKFVRSILKTKLGKGIILSLVRSEIGQVTLHQAWHDPSHIPSAVIHNYKQVLKLKNWNESLIRMAKVKPYSNSSKYHCALSAIDCPVWLLHGDDDKLVTMRESISLSQYYKYCFGPIQLNHCGHIPHEEIPNKFVNIVRNIITREFEEFNANKDLYQVNNGNGSSANVIGRGAQKLKEMIMNAGNKMNLNKKDDSNDKKENLNASQTSLVEAALPSQTESDHQNEQDNNHKMTENSSLLSD